MPAGSAPRPGSRPGESGEAGSLTSRRWGLPPRRSELEGPALPSVVAPAFALPTLSR